MHSVSEPICSKRDSSASRSASGTCSLALLWKLLAGHLGKRAPKDLTAPRTWFTSCVRQSTNACLERMMAMCHAPPDGILRHARPGPPHECGSPFLDPDRTGARDPLPDGRGLHQQRYSLSSLPKPQNGAQLRLEHLHQAASIGPLPGNSPSSQGRAGDERRFFVMPRSSYRAHRFLRQRVSASRSAFSRGSSHRYQDVPLPRRPPLDVTVAGPEVDHLLALVVDGAGRAKLVRQRVPAGLCDASADVGAGRARRRRLPFRHMNAAMKNAHTASRMRPTTLMIEGANPS